MLLEKGKEEWLAQNSRHSLAHWRLAEETRGCVQPVAHAHTIRAATHDATGDVVISYAPFQLALLDLILWRWYWTDSQQEQGCTNTCTLLCTGG